MSAHLLGYLFTPAARAGSLGSSNLGIFVALVLATLGYAALHRVRPAAEPPVSESRETEPVRVHA
ncbi:hypothetical protein ACFZC5_26450 [Nocardia gamkensis]|uniref:hypothetical protein n=1 Tax=Nocardia gamkensis TaxID=352869 RepID=UPI0036ECD968